MKALLTGGTGFVGSRLARRLVADDHAVAVLTRSGSQLHQLEDVAERLDLRRLDDDPATLPRILAEVRPDVVFHLATYYTYEHRPEDLAPLIDGNVLLPLRLVDAMARNGVPYLVNTGSAWQHYEDADYDPVCLHAATKQAFETLLEFFVNTGSIRCITLKLHDTYGPGDPRRKLFSLLDDGQAKPLEMSPGGQLIDLVHVDDVVAAFVLAAERLLAGQAERGHERFVVSSGRPLPLREVVEKFQALGDGGRTVLWGARPYRQREVMTPWRSAGTLPGWAPRIALDAGLRSLSPSTV